jgi:hypothetical protein
VFSDVQITAYISAIYACIRSSVLRERQLISGGYLGLCRWIGLDNSRENCPIRNFLPEHRQDLGSLLGSSSDSLSANEHLVGFIGDWTRVMRAARWAAGGSAGFLVGNGVNQPRFVLRIDRSSLVSLHANRS